MRRLDNALVLGGGGFLGSWLVRALLSHGASVVAVDRPGAVAVGGSNGVEAIEGDVLAMDLVGLLDGGRFDALFHLANASFVPPSLEDPAGDLRANAATTIAVLEALRSVPDPPVIAFASSAAVYGTGRVFPMTEDHPLEPVSPYGVSKLAAENYIAQYHRLYGVPGISFRIFSLYGPGQRKQVVYDWMQRLRGGERPLRVAGRADVSRDLVFVEDAAECFLEVTRRAPATGEAYNVASGDAVTLGDLVERAARALGVPAEAEFAGEVRRGDPYRWQGDNSRARALGVDFPTGLDEGLKRTADWLIGEEGRS